MSKGGTGQTVKRAAPFHGASSKVPRIKIQGLLCEFCAVEGTIREGTTYFDGHVSCDGHEAAIQRMANEVTDMRAVKDKDEEDN